MLLEFSEILGFFLIYCVLTGRPVLWNLEVTVCSRTCRTMLRFLEMSCEAGKLGCLIIGCGGLGVAAGVFDSVEGGRERLPAPTLGRPQNSQPEG